jgi:hypothetical protein
VDIKPESLAVGTEHCLTCVSYLMIVIMYQADCGYKTWKPGSEDLGLLDLCTLLDDGYNVACCGYNTWKAASGLRNASVAYFLWNDGFTVAAL